MTKETILKGGIPSRPKYRAETGSLVITGHESGYIRIWNSSEGDLDCSSVFEIDISAILLDDSPAVSVSKISFASDLLELSCSLFNGDVLLFAYETNKNYQPDVHELTGKMGSLELSSINANKQTIDISDRGPRNVKKGFMPQLLVKPLGNGKVTALCNSNIGFVSIGYESGQLVVINKRGNVVIFSEKLQDSGLSISIIPTSIEFGYGSPSETPLTSGSIFMYVGTSVGRLITYELVGDAKNRYVVRFINSVDCNDHEITNIIPIDSTTGRPCQPNIQILNSLKDGTPKAVPLVISASHNDIRITKLGTKMAHKSYSRGELSNIGITGTRTPNGNVGFCIVAILGGSKKLITLSLPGLVEMVNMRIPYRVEAKYAEHSSTLPMGDVFIRITETEAALVNIMKTRKPVMGLETTQNSDTLFLKTILVPFRPAANTLLKNTPNLTYDHLYRLLTNREKVPSREEDVKLSWLVSPYNPANYNLLGTGKPKYYDPNAIHKPVQVESSINPGLNANNIGARLCRRNK
ncbi:unnamed protein product [Ambrosiozyma monospora]|uniref:Unnamed protein product n=1 Tax=Ambrosiozyma monospora TaxID=43982 RepID=A0ACB5TA66_AMBMO|nr:unnamed protein product [Ambrosiozyma monospora]